MEPQTAKPLRIGDSVKSEWNQTKQSGQWVYLQYTDDMDSVEFVCKGSESMDEGKKSFKDMIGFLAINSFSGLPTSTMFPFHIVILYIPPSIMENEKLKRNLACFQVKEITENMGLSDYFFFECVSMENLTVESILKSISESQIKKRAVKLDDQGEFEFQMRGSFFTYPTNRVLMESVLRKEGGGRFSYNVKLRLHVLSADLTMTYYDEKSKMKGSYSITNSMFGRGAPPKSKSKNKKSKKKRRASVISFGRQKGRKMIDVNVPKDVYRSFYIETEKRTYRLQALNYHCCNLWLDSLSLIPGLKRVDYFVYKHDPSVLYADEEEISKKLENLNLNESPTTTSTTTQQDEEEEDDPFAGFDDPFQDFEKVFIPDTSTTSSPNTSKPSRLPKPSNLPGKPKCLPVARKTITPSNEDIIPTQLSPPTSPGGSIIKRAAPPSRSAPPLPPPTRSAPTLPPDEDNEQEPKNENIFTFEEVTTQPQPQQQQQLTEQVTKPPEQTTTQQSIVVPPEQTQTQHIEQPQQPQLQEQQQPQPEEEGEEEGEGEENNLENQRLREEVEQLKQALLDMKKKEQRNQQRIRSRGGRGGRGRSRGRGRIRGGRRSKFAPPVPRSRKTSNPPKPPPPPPSMKNCVINQQQNNSVGNILDDLKNFKLKGGKLKKMNIGNNNNINNNNNNNGKKKKLMEENDDFSGSVNLMSVLKKSILRRKGDMTGDDSDSDDSEGYWSDEDD